MDGKVFLIKSDTDYAMRMLVFLALTDAASPVTAAVLVEGQNIPVGFAYKILQKLRRAKILKSFKGVNGGFSLAKQACDISLLDVVEAVQGRIIIRPCLLWVMITVLRQSPARYPTNCRSYKRPSITKWKTSHWLKLFR
jgi:Rrf2 family protein